jgi:hypothetical protein
LPCWLPPSPIAAVGLNRARAVADDPEDGGLLNIVGFAEFY